MVYEYDQTVRNNFAMIKGYRVVVFVVKNFRYFFFIIQKKL